MSHLRLLHCLDSAERGQQCQQALMIPRQQAAELRADGGTVDWQPAVASALANKISIRPEQALPVAEKRRINETQVQVANETTLAASRRLFDHGLRTLTLNFANGIHPGGGFLDGARAQEEVLCRSSALYLTLHNDPMYAAHRHKPHMEASPWASLSPDVPVFRNDAGVALEQPWPLSILTCAAPYAPEVGQPRAGDLLQQRIQRVLAIAHAYGYTALVLGAWGCGAFANDPQRTAGDFHAALAGEFAGLFTEVVFAIADWSAERRFLTPFCRVLAA